MEFKNIENKVDKIMEKAGFCSIPFVIYGIACYVDIISNNLGTCKYAVWNLLAKL